LSMQRMMHGAAMHIPLAPPPPPPGSAFAIGGGGGGMLPHYLVPPVPPQPPMRTVTSMAGSAMDEEAGRTPSQSSMGLAWSGRGSVGTVSQRTPGVAASAADAAHSRPTLAPTASGGPA